MNWDWQTIKEQMRIVYAKAAQLLVFLIVCYYLLACIVAGKPVGPRSYVGFTYHCFQWRPTENIPVTHAASAGDNVYAGRPSHER